MLGMIIHELKASLNDFSKLRGARATISRKLSSGMGTYYSLVTWEYDDEANEDLSSDLSSHEGRDLAAADHLGCNGGVGG